ncbi:MAG TPA: S41 family peptidase [Gammaproteobacteria bacterium]
MATCRRRSTELRAAGCALLALVAGGVGRADAQSVPDAAASARLDEGFERTGPDGMPAAWSLGAGAAIDADVARDGEWSLRLRAADGRDARATLEVAPPRVDGNRIRLSLYARGDDGADAIELFVRVDGADGLLYVERRRAPIGTGAWHEVTIDVPRFASAERLRFAVSVERGTAFVDSVAIEGASTATLPPASAAARRYVDYALGLIDAHSIHRASVDWPAFRDAVLEQARGAVTRSDAYLAVRYAIGALGDVHGYLRPPDRAEALGQAPVSNARTGRPPIPPEGRLLPGGIGYVTVPGFAGGTHGQQVEFAETLQSLIRALDDEAGGACGWVVDLRGNSGGNLWPMLLGLGPLLGDGDALHATYRDGRRESVWYRDGKAGFGDYARLRVRGEAHRLRDADARIALLIGEDTASAGEVLAMAFRGVDGRRSFGAPTAGVNTGTRTFVLPDGAELVLAVVTMSDRTGRAYHGPIEPDVPAPSAPRGAPLAEQPDLRAALDWLREGC